MGFEPWNFSKHPKPLLPRMSRDEARNRGLGTLACHVLLRILLAWFIFARMASEHGAKNASGLRIVKFSVPVETTKKRSSG